MSSLKFCSSLSCWPGLSPSTVVTLLLADASGKGMSCGHSVGLGPFLKTRCGETSKGEKFEIVRYFQR